MADVRVRTKTFPVTLTVEQKVAVEAEASRRRRSRSAVIRDVIDSHYGLDPVEVVVGRTSAYRNGTG